MKREGEAGPFYAYAFYYLASEHSRARYDGRNAYTIATQPDYPTMGARVTLFVAVS